MNRFQNDVGNVEAGLRKPVTEFGFVTTATGSNPTKFVCTESLERVPNQIMKNDPFTLKEWLRELRIERLERSLQIAQQIFKKEQIR